MTCRRQHGFTLIELLVVVSIIGLLVAILLPVLGAARKSAEQVEELSAARMLLLGNRMYVDEHKGELFPTTDSTPDYTVRNNHGDVLWDHTTSTSDAGSHIGYSWRLAPYFDYNIEGALLVGDQAAIIDQYNPAAPTYYNYLTNQVPSLGMNYNMGLNYHPTLNPNPIDREVQIKQPADYLVAASAYSLIFPEYTKGHKFIRQPTGAYDPDPAKSGQFGNIDLRWNNKAVSAFLDGHAEMLAEDDFVNNPGLWDGS